MLNEAKTEYKTTEVNITCCGVVLVSCFWTVNGKHPYLCPKCGEEHLLDKRYPIITHESLLSPENDTHA